MSDGRFSSKPIRSGRPRDFARGEFSAEVLPTPDAARAFLDSPAVRRELDAVLDQPFPNVGELQCAPLPKKTPLPALDLGRPITSAVLDQEYLIGLIFLRVCGWIFLAFGILFLIVNLGMVIEVLLDGRDLGDRVGAVALLFVFGAGIAGAGLWFGILRGRVINQMCWFCPHGMIWLTGQMFEWYEWSEVPEVYCTLDAARPAIGLRFAGDISWITFGNTPASRLIVPYLENRASAAWIRPTLQAIADGRAIRFGVWRLRRSAIGDDAKEIEWRDVTDIERGRGELVFHHRGGRPLAIGLDEVPFPSMFIAIARSLLACSRQG